jgi:hypothetical protein
MIGGLAESENISQYFDFIEYLLIQLSLVYLSVYQWRFAVVFTVVMQTCFFEWNASKKVFLHLTVHTVHLGYLSFYIMWLGGDELVKSEQSTLHLCDLCSSWICPVGQYAG